MRKHKSTIARSNEMKACLRGSWWIAQVLCAEADRGRSPDMLADIADHYIGMMAKCKTIKEFERALDIDAYGGGSVPVEGDAN